jgi:hypothetical protein
MGVSVAFKGGGSMIGGGKTGGKGREERIDAGEGDEVRGGVGGAVLDAAEDETRGKGSVRTNWEVLCTPVLLFFRRLGVGEEGSEIGMARCSSAGVC